jgi:hypothetical protein
MLWEAEANLTSEPQADMTLKNKIINEHIWNVCS